MYEDTGTNYLNFKINPNGKVEYSPVYSIASTSREMEQFIIENVPKIEKYIENLLRVKFPEMFKS